jgi:hypothetical protein
VRLTAQQDACEPTWAVGGIAETLAGVPKQCLQLP